MKTTRILLLTAAMLLGTSTAQAQFGIINSIKKVKKTAEEVTEKVNGDIELTMSGKQIGVYRTRTRQIILNQKHDKGDRKGKSVIYTFEQNGDVTFDDGRKVAEVAANGNVNCQNTAPYLTVKADGSVVMDGETVGRIDTDGKVYMFDTWIGSAAGMPAQYAAYLYFGIYQTKESIAQIKVDLAEAAKKRAEEEARQKALAAEQAKASGSNTSKAATGNTQRKVREYRIEKGSARGFVDENGVVYNWAHKKIGQLPKGSSGDITNDTGHRIGSIWSGDIKNSSGNLVCHVTSGGSISVQGSNATVAEVRGAGRVDMTKDSKTLGYCDCHNNVWTAAIIFCDFFRF